MQRGTAEASCSYSGSHVPPHGMSRCTGLPGKAKLIRRHRDYHRVYAKRNAEGLQETGELTLSICHV